MTFSMQNNRQNIIFALLIALACSTTTDHVHAKYVTISKAPKSFLNKTQQAQFHHRWLREFHSYNKNKSKRVRNWYQNLMAQKSSDTVKELKSLYALAGRNVKYKTERKDYWSTPGETIARGYGDCDDYAHVYLTSAALLGYDQRDLWMVAGTFYGRYGPVGHAVAVVETKSGDQYVLDNLYQRVISEEQHHSFKPSYEINMEEQAAFVSVNTQFHDAF
ncbi:transglutaminase-like domain-containing protein [Kiloniella majae]|uniref:transglutaminase-like domain-containing protein n=1 Tax=Kiloniella majae TaxID=1938558 RepID=UPI000F77A611|nr:transglutaminase-like domain-containing protein [Kiloniella majae]